MKNLLKSSLSVPFFLTLVIPGLTQTLLPKQAVAPNLKTTVFVYNMAKVPSQVLAQAEGEASRIFREVDIEMEWMECPLPQTL
jgi:hypothetical protein